MTTITLLKYAEDGAMASMARRSEIMSKHNYAPEYVENFERALNDLKDIRLMITEADKELHPNLYKEG